MHEIEALERQGWEALCGPDGARFYDEVMADDGLMVFPDMALDKEQTLAAVRAAGPWTSFELSDVRIVEAAPGSAVIVYAAAAQRGAGAPYRAMMSSSYARRDGRWRLLLHQQTPAAIRR